VAESTTAPGYLACPVCGGELEVGDDAVVCRNAHRFPIHHGVPLLIASRENADITKSFSHEWAQYDYDEDRTWGTTVEQRLDEFLEHVQLTAGELEGKRVLDAGCGNGALSNAITTLGCDVVATDISESVFAAARRFQDNPRLMFVQSDLSRSAFAPGSFDVIYCAGVLHHTPSTHGSLLEVVKALRSGGTIFVWLYQHVPGTTLAVKSKLRRAMAPLPLRVKHALVVPVAAQAQLRHPDEGLSWRERMVVQLDYFTPRWRWEHTPEELEGWFTDLGLVEIALTEQGKDGFGVVGRLPLS
jgi:SAM-dependent methyltransferase